MNCDNSAKFYLYKIENNIDQVKYKNFTYGEYFSLDGPCPYADQLDIPMFLPKVDLVLTRQ
jgi:hypothetical protein